MGDIGRDGRRGRRRRRDWWLTQEKRKSQRGAYINGRGGLDQDSRRARGVDDACDRRRGRVLGDRETAAGRRDDRASEALETVRCGRAAGGRRLLGRGRFLGRCRLRSCCRRQVSLNRGLAVAVGHERDPVGSGDG